MRRRERIRAMRREIERRGGIVGVAPDAPDDVLDLLYEIMLDCPECAGLDERGIVEVEH
ncbi:MAG TPA: hypothetical protein VIL97_10595 [Thermoanaerobaculia bacterium]